MGNKHYNCPQFLAGTTEEACVVVSSEGMHTKYVTDTVAYYNGKIGSFKNVQELGRKKVLEDKKMKKKKNWNILDSNDPCMFAQ